MPCVVAALAAIFAAKPSFELFSHLIIILAFVIAIYRQSFAKSEMQKEVEAKLAAGEKTFDAKVCQNNFPNVDEWLQNELPKYKGTEALMRRQWHYKYAPDETWTLRFTATQNPDQQGHYSMWK